MKYLNRAHIESLDISMHEIIDTVETMFREKGLGKIEMPVKTGIRPGTDAFIHAMPAFIPSINAAGMKWIASFPSNVEKRLPIISGLIILSDATTGAPLAVMDATWITAKRTGAATAIGAKYLARKNCETVGIIACGVQGRSNLEALSCLFTIKKVKAYDISRQTAEKFAREMSVQLNIDVEAVSSPEHAVRDMDMIVTSTPIAKQPSPVIEYSWLNQGAFASAVDYDSYWKADALKKAAKLVTDDIPQMEFYRNAGYFQSTPRAHAELGEIVCGKKPGRTSDREFCICMNLGIAACDIVTAQLVYEKCIEKGVGVEIE